ncbi:uncharacterized protein LOC115663353 [Syzygium oleosum]|uniref:uncharacterized protein LOC115663353 n=2 Tax=Syzygium oleosum TaxID=219896 RepID=UPI0024BB3AE3|nr:uncharacterized protein LOC115663353 [Syzygium oleosum]
MAAQFHNAMGAYERVRTEDANGDVEKASPDPKAGLPRAGVGFVVGVGDVEAAGRVPGSRSASRRGGRESERRQQRLVSLDVFRGLSVVLMIVVDHAGGIFPAINHSPWDGLTLADYVMPFFLFIVGVSLGLGYKKMPCRASATRKVLLRALKLLLLGLFLQGGYFHGVGSLDYGVDMEQMRFMGILQRIAIAFMVAALCEIWLKGDDDVKSAFSLLKKYRSHWAVVLVLTTVYISLLYGLYVPDWEYRIPTESPSLSQERILVKCGVRGNTGPACNAVAMIDREVLGIRHLYRKPAYARTKQCSIHSPESGPLPANAPSWCQAPFDPEGLLSSVMAVVTCLVGLHFGHVIVHFKDHGDRTFHWMVSSSFLVALGLALDLFGMHVNKALYTCSYMAVTAGVAGILFTLIYLMVDFGGLRHTTTVLEWIGKNAMTIYVLAATNVLPVFLQGFYWRRPENNILSLIGIGR